ncbi:hypothetical protein EV686_11417 [Paracandidimonas soli]|uniref:Uncharacterized protein n=2 Tax=Paracandidimonas soli TaxID=1917182 RepID=A0A4R3UPK6_9BURK|nr:hypothetical protein EV686_11417 [Paracandidimonas soli]
MQAYARAAIEADRKRRGEPVAYRLLRKNADGEWVTDGRPWCDGVPDADLVKDSEKSGQYRIEYAFAAPQPAEPVKVPSDADIDAVFNDMPDGANSWLKSWGYRQFARALLARYATTKEQP